MKAALLNAVVLVSFFPLAASAQSIVEVAGTREVKRISGDGQHALTDTSLVGPGYQLQRITPAGTEWYCTGLSHDGSTVMGHRTVDGVRYPARWTAVTGWVHFNLPQSTLSAGFSESSADASCILGSAEFGPNDWRSFLWRESTGYQFIDCCTATPPGGISSDGRTVTGYRWISARMFAFHWRQDQGLQQLPLPPGALFSFPWGISGDGHTVTGYFKMNVPTPPAIACAWVDGQLRTLPLPSGAVGGYALEPSSDGRIIGGMWYDSTNTRRACVWTSTGVHDLTTLLTSSGVNLSNWRILNECLDVSDDGLRVVGYGENALFRRAGWIATLPHTLRCLSADIDQDGVTSDADVQAFFACLGGNCCSTCDQRAADFNGDGDAATDQDIESFFRVLIGQHC
ncbi:MAG TPA: hypothetical protein VD997_15485 [Phycisphaerales bacterium]|nr:hypothetical protein [Phycisphaerales bacterium]